MSTADPPDFSLLLKQSEHIAEKTGDRFTIPRNLQQLAEASRRQLEKHGTAAGITSTSKANANALLSEKGYNVEKLTASLSKIHMKAKVQPREPLRPTDLKGFLDHRYRMTILTAIEETNTHTSERFEENYLHSMLKEWRDHKTRVLEEELDRCSLNWPSSEYAMEGGVGGGTSAMDVEGKTMGSTPARGAGAGGFGTPSHVKTHGAAVGASGGVRLPTALSRTPGSHLAPLFTAKMKKYAQVVVQMNSTLLSKRPYYPLVHEFRRATESIDDRDLNKKHVVVECWKLLEKMTDVAGKESVNLYERYRREEPELRQELVEAARNFLEEQMWNHIERTLRQRQNAHVHLGGDPNPTNNIREFLKLRKLSSSWALVYHLIRCGKGKDAVKVARENTDTKGFAEYIRLYYENNCRLPAQEQRVVQEELKTMQTEKDDVHHAYKRAVFVVVGQCTGRQQNNSRVFKTAPDFMWLKLCLIEETSTEATSLDGGFQLVHLQQLLLRHGPQHFNPKGTNPLLYFQVLLLSQQFERAVHYLLRTKEYRTEAVHVAIALYHHGLLLQPESDDPSFDPSKGPLFWEPPGASSTSGEPQSPSRSGVDTPWSSMASKGRHSFSAVDYTPLHSNRGSSRMTAGRARVSMAESNQAHPRQTPPVPVGAARPTLNMIRLIQGMYIKEFERGDPDLALHYLYVLRDRLSTACMREFVMETRAHKLLFESEYTQMLGTEEEVRELKIASARKYEEQGYYDDAIELYQRAEDYDAMLAVMNKAISKVLTSNDEASSALIARFCTVFDQIVNRLQSTWRSYSTFHLLLMLADFFQYFRGGPSQYEAALHMIKRTMLLPIVDDVDRDGDLERALRMYHDVEPHVQGHYPDVLFCTMRILQHQYQRTIHRPEDLRACKEQGRYLLLFANKLNTLTPRALSELAALESKMVPFDHSR